MGEQFPKSDRQIELPPYRADRGIKVQTSIVKRQEQGEGGGAFGRRPHGGKGFRQPRRGAIFRQGAAGQMKDFLPMLPNGKRGSDFTPLGKIPVEACGGS